MIETSASRTLQPGSIGHMRIPTKVLMCFGGEHSSRCCARPSPVSLHAPYFARRFTKRSAARRRSSLSVLPHWTGIRTSCGKGMGRYGGLSRTATASQACSRRQRKQRELYQNRILQLPDTKTPPRGSDIAARRTPKRLLAGRRHFILLYLRIMDYAQRPDCRKWNGSSGRSGSNGTGK
jgi:hypothetical protein